MQFAGKLTLADLKDVQKATRPKSYWPKRILRHWYGYAFLCFLAGVTIAGLAGVTKPDWGPIELMWAAIIVLTAWFRFRAKKATARGLAKLNAALPDWIHLTEDGIKFDSANGATSFLPWENFKGWREGQRVILVERTQGAGYVILPVADLSDAAREPVRQFLRAHINALVPQAT